MAFDEGLVAREFVLDDNLVHLNHGGVGPWPRRCADAVQAFAEANCTRSYAGHFTEWMATETRLRERLRALLNASSADDIALLKNTSEGLSQIAAGIDWRPGDRVVALAEEFVSNLVVWESLARHGVELVRVVPAAGQTPDDALETACDERTRLLSVSSVQYGTGWRADLHRLGRFCKANGILFCIDAIQSLGALKLDAAECHADFVVAGAHKWMMSPFGIAVFYCHPGVRDQLAPLAYGWPTLADPMRFHGSLDEMETSARRFEAGTQNLAAVMGFEATLSVLDELGHAAIERRVLDNAAYLAGALAARDDVQLLSPRQEGRFGGNVCMTVVRVDRAGLAELASRLESEAGILCAARGPSLRFGPHFYQAHALLDSALARIHRVLDTRP